MTRKALLALMLIGLTQNGYCGWKDALKEVAKQAIEQSTQAQAQQSSAQQETVGSGNADSPQKTAGQVRQDAQEKQNIRVIEQTYPRDWLTQFRMMQYGFKPDDKVAVDKVVALENLLVKVVSVSNVSQASIGSGLKMKEIFAIFDIDEKNEAQLNEFMSWMKFRFKPVFLRNCTNLYQITKTLDFNSIDSMPNQQKLDYILWGHFDADRKSPYLVMDSPLKGKPLQIDAADVETAYNGYRGIGNDHPVLARAKELAQESAIAKKQKDERIRQLEVLSRKSGKPDVTVSIGANQYYGTLTFDIQSTADKATIWKVSVNRGNCSLPEGTAADIEKTVTLGFGQTYRGYSNDCKMQNVREIEVTTENGRFVFNF